MTCIFTKVQNIRREFANVRAQKKLMDTLPDFKKAESAIWRQAFQSHFIQQRQVIDMIDPYLVQPIREGRR